MQRSLVALGVAAISWSLGCGTGGVGSTAGEPAALTTYVGRGHDGDGTLRDVVGLVLKNERLLFFACGDEPTNTMTAWVEVDLPSHAGAERVIDAEGNWTLHATLSAGVASGTATERGTAREVHWDALPIQVGDVAGVYTDHAPCATGAVVLPSGAGVQGSYCTANMRAQVTPLKPPDAAGGMVWIDDATGGLRVELDPGNQPVLTRAEPSDG